MLKIEKINQFYGQSHTLWDLDLEIKKGRCTCIMGRNGVGKTTLSKVIMGLLPIKDGKLLYKKKDISKLSDYKRANIAIGYVPQGREIFSQLTVKENLEIGVLSNRNKITKVPEKIYDLFPVLKQMEKRKGGDLSGGQQQQLAIARALCIDPEFLILDEPSEGIQPNIVSQIGEVIDYLTKEENITVMLVEQKLPFARKHGDDFYVIDRGSVVANGEINQLSDDIIKKHLSV
ncbi:urea ABC transporter ATP-binding subunit UrtE [Malaciobacter molluscorum LMG 25693]|uniref:Urea ABC transporter ATP-binding subunit UrtE n=1 Tax=Malaciobacter molluscorum LMG 25693 TaxID=870501 RepID=A0A2G1DJF1_9BACT|nr:urea ABC transporter ATP-binding subunit UrtE [Malaciobacter molluscorum]AXX91604.1 urea ABC transporter UrtABCDE, ATP-binding protein [Malaciobacter molluscorum LMG 25693]PHO18601.1 urea ABC transporter ATP-binding subunit UrtE [Malaciobacter molluscorum LMG 25693]RXJ94568.1 urea ABC transporter ATP-binding subunit UrtE [Malaciobacter molluscorum]